MAKKPKPKLNFGEGDGHNFIAKHCEKLILLAVALLVGFFVYSGMSLEGVEDNKTPEALRNLANQAKSKLDGTTWDAVKQQPERDPSDITRRLAERGPDVLPATDPTPYTLHTSLLPQPFRRKAKRADPPLLPPEEVVVKPFYGPVAMRGNPAADQLMQAARDAKAAEEAAKPKRASKRASSERYPGSEMYDEAGGGEAMPGGMMYGSSSTAASGPRATQEQLANVKGYRPGASGGGASMGYESAPSYGEDAGGYGYGGGGGGTTTGTVAKGTYGMAILALVPFKKQWSEFEHTFMDAYDFNPARDVPRYYWYQVERVEVNDAGEVVDQLKDPYNPRWVAWYQQQFAGNPEFVVDPAYFDKLLTTPVPPLMLRDLEPLQLHSSKTPKRQILVRRPEPRRATDAPPPPTGGIGPGPLPRAGGYGSNRGGYGMPGGDAGGYGADGAMPGGYGGYGESADAAMPGGYGGGYGESAYGDAGGYGESAGGYGESGYGESGYGSSMGSGYGANARPVPGPSVDYKLFRYFDLTVAPGKKYKYRVKLFLVDPNHPADPQATPPSPYLQDDVIARIRAVDQKDAADSQSTGQPSRTFWVETEWSEWSEAVSIPPQYEVLAGEAAPVRKFPNREAQVEIPEPYAEPEGKVLAIDWDHEKAADIPAQQTVFRGSMLNFKADPAVLHPVTLQVLKLKDYPITTDCLILDVQGGEPLPTSDRANIDHKAPGEFLLMNAQGELVVHNELDDIAGYRNNYFTEPEKPKVAPIETEMGEEYYGMPGEEGGGGRGRKKRGDGGHGGP